MYEKTEKVVAELKDKWDKTEEKPALIGLVTASIVLVYVLNGIVSAIDKIPVVSGLFELIGIFVSSWFVYRYLVFGPGTTPALASSRLTSYGKTLRPSSYRSPGAQAEHSRIFQEGTRQGLSRRALSKAQVPTVHRRSVAFCQNKDQQWHKNSKLPVLDLCLFCCLSISCNIYEHNVNFHFTRLGFPAAHMQPSLSCL